MTWNMAAGYAFDAAQHERAWEWLDLQSADVALLQEVVLPRTLNRRWRTAFHSRSRWRGSVAWGSAVLATEDRYQPYEATAEDSWLPELQGSLCVAAPTADDGNAPWLVSLHSSASAMNPERFGERDVDDVQVCKPGTMWEVEAAMHDLERILRGRRFLAGGDLNSARLFDSAHSEPWNQFLFDNLRRAGFVDLRPRHFPNEQQTFFRPRPGPYQLDHVFADEQTEATVASWRVVSEVAEELDLSDHAPVIVELH